MNKYKRWSEIEIEKLKDLTKKGLTAQEISKQLNRNIHTIQVYQSKLNLTRKTPKLIKWTDNNINRLIKMINDNIKIKDIAINLNVSLSSIHSICYKKNIVIPNKHKPFNDSEKQFIVENYVQYGANFCAEYLSRPLWLVSKYANSIGLVCKIIKSSEQYKYLKLINPSYFNSIRKSAVQRNIEFNISPKYLWDLFINQNEKCNASGEKLILPSNNKDKMKRTASLDRIDSSKGYIEGNVQWVHRYVNTMKWDFEENEWLIWIEKIYKHRIEK